MPANWKTILVYFVTWTILYQFAYSLVRFSWCALHGGSLEHALIYMLHRQATMQYWTLFLGEVLIHYLLVIGIAFRTLDVRAIRRPGNPAIRALFVSGEVGLILYLLLILRRWHLMGAWILAAGLPEMLATLGAGYALRFYWPAAPQAPPDMPPTEGVWPPPPQAAS